MVNDYGFYISQLAVRGTGKRPAILMFNPGFNVISGLSDTGKSYAFACIRYMLGVGDSPKEIPESKDYTEILLEIRTYKGKSYTLQRGIKEGNFYLKETELAKFEIAGSAKELKQEHSATNADNISTFLLSLSGFSDKEVKRNKSNKKRTLRFRDIAKLTLVDEIRICEEISPVHLGQYTEKVEEQSVFKLVLTGVDASELQEIEEEKVYISRTKGKLELVDSFIEQVSRQLEKFPQQNFENRKNGLQRRFDELSVVMVQTSRNLEQLTSKKQNLYNRIKELESADLLQNELLERFILLNDHYNSDLKRLEFITEGESYFAQLTTVTCPLCGNQMDKDHYDCIIYENGNDIKVIDSIVREVQKIKLKISDLNSTISEINIERQERAIELKALNAEFNTINSRIVHEIEPIRSVTSEQIDEIIKEQSSLNERTALKSRLDEYYVQKRIIEDELKNKPKAANSGLGIEATTYRELCNEIEQLLKAWKYADSVDVQFNSSYQTFDIVINSKNRNAHGKGIRAITYSAFIIGVMQYCIKHNLPHPKNIILDSPLTTYHGKEKPKNIEDAPKNMQDFFFKGLATNSADRQVIVFDNKEPAQDVISSINYIKFTDDPANGRAGFFPR